MPKMANGSKVRRSELPDTLKRSGPKAQRTFAKTHDAAVEQYGEGERAHRTAMASLKHTHEKRGDRRVPKERPGRATHGRRKRRHRSGAAKGRPSGASTSSRTRRTSCTNEPAVSVSRVARRCRSANSRA